MEVPVVMVVMAACVVAVTTGTAMRAVIMTVVVQIHAAMHRFVAHVLIIPGAGRVVQVVVQVVDREVVLNYSQPVF